MERAPSPKPNFELDSDFQFFDPSGPAPNAAPIPNSTPALDPDFQFFSQSDLENPWAMAEKSQTRQSSQEVSPREEKHNKLNPKEKVLFARLGAVALTAAMLSAPIAKVNSAAAKPKAPVATEAPAATKTPAPIETAPSDPFKIIVDVVDTAPAMRQVKIPEAETPEIEIPGLSRPNAANNLSDLSSLREDLDSLLASEFHFVDEEPTPVPEVSPVKEVKKIWEGKALNAYDGHVDGPTGDETYYNLPMGGIVDRMHRMGVEGDYWVREDGVKMLGDFVMVAANLTTHPRGSIVETTLGTGIVCDTGSFAEDHPNRLDIATDW